MIRSPSGLRLTTPAAGTLLLVLAAVPTVSVRPPRSRERGGLPIGPVPSAHGHLPARSSTVARDTAAIVDGSVRRAEDGTPISGARVIVVGRNREVLTDSAGHFRIGGLSPGAVTLRVQYPDAQPAERHLLLREDESTTLAIAMMTRPIPQSGLRAVAPGRAPSTPVSRLLKRLEAPRGQIVGHDEIATIEIYPPKDVPTDLDTETAEECGAIVLWLKSYLGGR